MRHNELIFESAPPSPLGGLLPNDTRGIGNNAAVGRLAKAKIRLLELQTQIKASETWAVLAVFQGMDGSGKDSTIAHVFSGLDPGALQVHAFKRPSAEESLHDLLWREHHAVPQAGHFGVFNRSHYENVLIAHAHPELVASRHLPASLSGPGFREGQMEDIVHFERMLARRGVAICKFFLHISRAEQRDRLLRRLDDPHKAWKFEPSDLVERGHWDAYQRAYAETIATTATPSAPWAIIPADSKPVARVLVAEILADRLESLDVVLPQPDPDMLHTARRALRADSGG